METTTQKENRKCPKCGNASQQRNFGFNRSGTQRVQCYACKCTYTLNPKTRIIPDEIRKIALREYYSGVSGRGVGKIHNMHKNNVYNWIKKNRSDMDKSSDEI